MAEALSLHHEAFIPVAVGLFLLPVLLYLISMALPLRGRLQGALSTLAELCIWNGLFLSLLMAFSAAQGPVPATVDGLHDTLALHRGWATRATWAFAILALWSWYYHRTGIRQRLHLIGASLLGTSLILVAGGVAAT